MWLCALCGVSLGQNNWARHVREVHRRWKTRNLTIMRYLFRHRLNITETIADLKTVKPAKRFAVEAEVRPLAEELLEIRDTLRFPSTIVTRGLARGTKLLPNDKKGAVADVLNRYLTARAATRVSLEAFLRQDESEGRNWLITKADSKQRDGLLRRHMRRVLPRTNNVPENQDVASLPQP
jgi:hypothetical protein